MPAFAGHCEDQAGITPDSAGSAAEGTGAGPGRLGHTPRLAPSLGGGGACHLWGLALYLNTKGPNEMSLTPTFGFRQLRLALFWGLGAGEAGGRGVRRTVGSGHEHGSRLSGRVDREGLSLLLCDSVSSREKMRVRLSVGAVRMRAAGVWGTGGVAKPGGGACAWRGWAGLSSPARWAGSGRPGSRWSLGWLPGPQQSESPCNTLTIPPPPAQRGRPSLDPGVRGGP